MLKFVLASTSPRRLTLLTDAGYDVRVVDPGDAEDEVADEGTVESQALRRARAKANACVSRVAAASQQLLVIAADTIVALGDEPLGQPADRAQAAEMLARLSGTTHQVITGVSLILVGQPSWKRRDFAETTTVRMRAWTEQEIADYVASGESDGKAGAYAIQETADRFVEALDGSFSNVVGFPLERFAEELASWDAFEL